MKKTFKCLVIALIFSLACAAMPSSLEAVELSGKWKAKMDEFERKLRRVDEKDIEKLSADITQKAGTDTIAQAIVALKIWQELRKENLTQKKKNLVKPKDKRDLMKSKKENLRYGL